MADVQDAVRKYLLANVAVSALIGNRMTFEDLPEKSSMPAATISIVSQVTDHDLGNLSGIETTRLQIDCFSNTRLECNEIARAIKSSGLVAFRGDYESVTFHGVMVEDGQRTFTEQPQDGSDSKRYVTNFDFEVVHSA